MLTHLLKQPNHTPTNNQKQQQMISTSHVNAQEMFERDVNGVVKFFAMKMRYVPEPEEIPNFAEVRVGLCLSVLVGRSVGGFVCLFVGPALDPEKKNAVD